MRDGPSARASTAQRLVEAGGKALEHRRAVLLCGARVHGVGVWVREREGGAKERGEREKREREATWREGEADKRLRALRPPHSANTVGYIVGE